MVVPLMLIRTENLKKNYGGKTVLEDVRLELEAGEIVGICGKSGIGKSTLARILCGVVRPDAGRVYLEEQLLFSADSPYDRKRGLGIQLVCQQPYASLDPSQRLKAGLLELIRYHKLAKRQEEEALLRSLLSRVGLEPALLNQLPHQISGGEAQRLALAKALLFSPKLLILDEATSMLDVSTQANVLGLVKSNMKQTGGSVLMISHDRELLNHICHRQYLLDNKNLKEIPGV